MVTRGKAEREKVNKGKGGQKRFDFGCEHTMYYTDDVLLKCTFETYLILLNNVTPINLI